MFLVHQLFLNKMFQKL